MMIKASILKNSISVFLISLILVLSFLFYSYMRSVDIGERTVTVIIESGDPFQKIAEEIVAAGVVDFPFMLKYPALFMGIDRMITPGRYDFSGENSCKSVLKKLAEADFLKIKMTFPEGSRIWDVASAMKDQLFLDSAKVVGFDSDSSFLTSYGIASLEGYLYPETYFFRWGISEEDALSEMVGIFKIQTKSLWKDTVNTGLSLAETIIMASIIESETGSGAERGKVSSVYHNRLKKKMKLQADPTVIYGLGGLDRDLMKRDLKKDTPFNTYLHKGLTPAPINSPGLEAIKAALNPPETDYLYFVAEIDGGHYFSRTNAEHSRAVRRIKKEKREKKN